MNSKEVAQWIEEAREAGAIKLVVHRAKKGGGRQSVFATLPMKNLDVAALLVRMREDVIQTRGLPSATFECQALDDDANDVRVERIIISRNEERDPTDIDPHVEMMRIMATREQQTHAKMLETVDRMLTVNSTLESVLATYRDKEAERLTAMFDFALMKREQEDAIQLSADRRAMWAKGLEELGPIVSAAVTKLSKNAAPAFMGLFNSLKAEQLDVIMQTLTAEQRATFGTVIDELQKSRKGEG